jgi:hypothetical protein
VLPAGASAKVGGEPTLAPNADTGAIVEVDRWSCGDTPFGTLGEHF